MGNLKQMRARSCPRNLSNELKDKKGGEREEKLDMFVERGSKENISKYNFHFNCFLL